MPKAFTTADVMAGEYPRISTSPEDLLRDEPAWMKKGRQETPSGYGRRLNTGKKIQFNGKLYRLYATCFSNVASVWFTTKGEKIFVD